MNSLFPRRSLPGGAKRAAAFALGCAALALACSKAPVTGRVQYNLLPDSIMRGIGKTTYRATLSDAKVQKGGEDADVLSKVGRRIAKVAAEPKFDWAFSLIDSEDVNAWCLPGGYIGFYTGILPALRNEAGMAFVMGHEVGHATASHGSERLTQQLTLVGGLVGLEAYLQDHSTLDPKQRGILLGALGLGATVGVMLPFSRMHESEADTIGMMYMARAGYPPGESIELWDRMERLTGGSGIPAFLSTHPSNKMRQANLKEWMPQARKKYQRNKLDYDTQKALWAAREDDRSGGKR